MTGIDSESGAARERIVALARDLMLIPGTATRPEDRERCFQFVKNHLEALQGIVVREFSCEGIPSLIAAPSGGDAVDVLICAHLDVVDHPAMDAYRSRVEDGRIIGAGAGDMKGTLAVMMEVFRTLHARQPGASLGMVVTSDEEMGGEHGLGYLCAAGAIQCRAAIIPDGGAPDEIIVEEKGILHVLLESTGRAAHAARPWSGANPVDPLLRTLLDLRRRFDAFHGGTDWWHPTCTPTGLKTSSETRNRIPESAEAVLDIRFPAPHRVAEMHGLVEAALAPGVRARPLVSAEPTRLDPDPLFVGTVRAAMPGEVRLTRSDGGSDARFLNPLGVQIAMARPRVGNLHSPEEWIEIDSMMAFHEVCLRYLSRRLKL